jgi:hypothetical protein
MDDLVRTQVLLEKKQRSELQRIASKEGVSFSELVRTLLDIQLQNHKYQEMELAAKNLLEDYQEGNGLTDLTALDGEDFLNA